MDDAPDRRAERLARRVRIGVRLVFYPAALALIVFAWQHYHGSSASGHTTQIAGWSGITSQGQKISAITGDDRLVYVEAPIVERCTNGGLVTFRWTPGEGRFEQRAREVRGQSVAVTRTRAGETVAYDNRLWVTVDEPLRGSMKGTSFYRDRPGNFRCESGPVTFALTRAAAPQRAAPGAR